jgi:hypothetical protein
LQILKDLVQRTIAIPLIKQSPDRLPLSKLFRHISPGSASTKNPKNPIKDIATVKRRPTTRFTGWYHLLDALPLIVAHA